MLLAICEDKLAIFAPTANYFRQCKVVTEPHRREEPHSAWMDNIKTWTGLPVEESIRMTEDRDKWRKYVHGAANRRIKDD